MKNKPLIGYNILSLLGVLMILAGMGWNLRAGFQIDIATCLFLGAAILFLTGMPLLHYTFAKPLSYLKREMKNFSKAWFDEDPTSGEEITDIVQGLSRIHEKVDKATFEVKELEATINVYAIEKKQMEAILRSLPIAVLVTDRFNELILTNDVAQKLFGFEQEATQGKKLSEVLGWKELVELIHATAERKVKVPRRMVELTYKGEEEKDEKALRVLLSSITDQSDQILGVVTIIQDATKDREIDRMKSEFVANVSHELKAPISSIKAYTEILLDGEAPDEKARQDFCTIIETEANRLSNMIDNLLDLSRLEAGVIQMNMERLNLINLLKSIEHTMRPSANKKQIVLATDISQYIVPVAGDRDQLNRVFVNLLSNAIKYTPEKGRVDLTARLEGDHIRVDVSDTGYGIPEESLPKIFEKFFRVKENKTVAQGTGMGLAMVKQILEKHNAEIKVSSKPGEGSCFSVFIPVAN